MRANRLVIIGAGGHGRDVLDVVEAAGGFEVLGFLDDGDPAVAPLAARGSRLLGAVSALADLGDVSVLIGIGDASMRAQLAERIAGTPGLGPSPAVVHPSASLGWGMVAGAGTVVVAGAVLSGNVSLGRHTYVGHNVTIGHDSVLEDFATVFPGATVSGAVRVGRAATIGANAAIRQGLTIGEGAVVGMGAVVIADVAAGSTVVGNPARPPRPGS